jgi:hypothetical protein
MAAVPVTAPEVTMTNPTPGTNPDSRDDDEEFLVFLGDWADGQGNWQDPLQYDDPAWTAPGDRQEKTHE